MNKETKKNMIVDNILIMVFSASNLIYLGSIIGQVAPKPNTFMPFGNGVHSCPGNELAKLEILVLLHHLTTKYRYGSSNT